MEKKERKQRKRENRGIYNREINNREILNKQTERKPSANMDVAAVGAAKADSSSGAAAGGGGPSKDDAYGLNEDWSENDDDDDVSEDDNDVNGGNANGGITDGSKSVQRPSIKGDGGKKSKSRDSDDDSDDDDDDDDEGSDDSAVESSEFMLHNATEKGDVLAVKRLIELHMTSSRYVDHRMTLEMEHKEDPETLKLVLLKWEATHLARLLEKRDHEGCTPLHVAIMWRQLECMQVLLTAGAKKRTVCNLSPIPHLILGIGSVEKCRKFAVEALELVLAVEDHAAVAATSPNKTDKIDVATLDDLKRTCLHLCAEYDEVEALAMLIRHGGLTNVWLLPELEGRLASHIACRASHLEILKTLVEGVPKEMKSLFLERGDMYDMTALHVSAANGFTEGTKYLLTVAPELASRKDGRGRLPADWARAHGHKEDLALLTQDDADAAMSDTQQVANGVADSASSATKKPTLVLAHEICERHYTCRPAWTRNRGFFDVPPENVNRLKVLLNDEIGSLRCSRLAKSLQWGVPTQAEIADILRVHDFAYVQKIRGFAAQLNEDEIGELDTDTSISGKSFEAALYAAGSVCNGIDSVMRGENRNVFCAVRPPGHHAGPRGVVTNKLDPNGSYGFCILSNAAIGAAYARNVYRHQGVKKVAIVDFDVHHGNGTEACVRNVVPGEHKSSLETPLCTVQLTQPTYKPWLSEDDPDNIFFASIHGYGKRVPGLDPDPLAPPRVGMFYPSDGANYGFGNYGKPGPGEPHIVDVGQNSKSRMEWRTSWRVHVLPKLAEFKPDLIIISAGFDAHMRDDINMGYLSILEHDYYWLTRQLVKIANSYSKGRIVSVLEGGYKIQGQIISPFARSVSSHVAALTESSSTELYDPEDAAWEEDREATLLLERRRAMEQARANALQNNMDIDLGEGPSRKRPRRAAASREIDYVKLNRELQEESRKQHQARLQEQEQQQQEQKQEQQQEQQQA